MNGCGHVTQANIDFYFCWDGKFLKWFVVGIYDACGFGMLWMKCLVLFVALIDVCMAQTSPIIWYPFEVSSYIGTSCVAYDYYNKFCNNHSTFDGYLRNHGSLGSEYDLINENQEYSYATSRVETLNRVPILSRDTVDSGTAVFYNKTGSMKSKGSLSLTLPLTVSIWINLYQNLASNDEVYGNGGNVFGFGNSGAGIRLAFFARGHLVNVNGVECPYDLWATTYPKNEWMQLTMTIEYTSAVQTKLYRNGVLIMSCVGASGVPMQNSNLDYIRLGKRIWLVSSGFDTPFSGFIDDFRVYNYVLSSAEITALQTPQEVQTCQAGFTKQAGSCQACPLSTYKPLSGDFECIACETGSYTQNTNAVSCTCSGAYVRPSSPGLYLCSACQASTYKTSDMQLCTACAIGTYSAAGSSQCTSCPSGYRNDFGQQTDASQCYFCDIAPPGSCKPAIHYSFDSFYIDPNYGLSYGYYWFRNQGYLGSSFDARAESVYNPPSYSYIPPTLSSDSQTGLSYVVPNRRLFIYGSISDWTLFDMPFTFALYFQLSTTYTGGDYSLFNLGQDRMLKIGGNSECIQVSVSPVDSYGVESSSSNVISVSYCWEDYGLPQGPKIPFTKGVWYNVLVTVMDNINNLGVVSLYIDGALKNTVTCPYTLRYSIAQRRTYQIGNNFEGKIDEFKIFPTTLTSYVIGETSRKSCDVRTYWNASIMECVPCADGYYKSEFSVALCTACPTGTWTMQGAGGAMNMSDCTRCSAGYTGADSVSGVAVCTACVAGKYKSAIGSGSCTSCGSFMTSVAGTTSVSGCMCGPGYSGPGGGPCVPCASGTYKDVSGSGACTTCGVDGSGPLGSTAFANCVFACAPGKTGPDGSCSACVAGKYKTTSGSVVCTDCGVGTYSTTVGASAASTCVSCPVNSNSVASSSAITGCTCNAGYTGPDGGVCSACVPGKYKTSGGSAVCMDCGVGTYSVAVGATVSATCVSCVANSNSGVSSSSSVACVCNAGFTGPDGGVCSGCVAGKYKTSSGSAACTDCGMTTYSVTVGASASSTCVACPATTNAPSSSSDVTACACNVGYTGANGGPCTACVAGKFKDVSGSAACSDCSAGTYLLTTGATAAGTCSACAANSYSVALGASTSTTCTCNTGYTGPDGGVCSACLPGTFKTQTGSAACELCPNNTFSVDIGRTSSCLPCQVNAVSVAGSVSQDYCYCKSGYAHAVGMYTCRICDPGTYNSQLGRTACSNCSIGMYSVNYGAIGKETCLTCPLGQWSPEGSPNCNLCPANSRAGASSGFLKNCTCDKGYSGADGSTCVACAAATYKETTGPGTCIACPALTSTSGAAVSVSDCWCMTGYVKIAGACVTMVPRVVAVDGKLTGVYANSSASYIENATAALRASIALRLNIPIDLVQIDRVSNSSDVRVSIFGRSETELNIIERDIGLATTVPSVLNLPFTMTANTASVPAEPRAVVIAGRLLNMSGTDSRRLLLQASDVLSTNSNIGAQALAALRLEMSKHFRVPATSVRFSFDTLAENNTLPLTVTIDVGSEEEMQTARNVSDTLNSGGRLLLWNSVIFLIYSAQDAGPSGLKFSTTLVRADGTPMTLEEIQGGSTLQVLKRQLSVYYNVPQSAVDVTVVFENGVYSVQSVVRAVQPVTVETLQERFEEATPALDVASVVLKLPFQMQDMDIEFASVPVVPGVSLPNAVSIESDLVYSDGTPLSDSEVAQASDTLIWQMSQFYGVDTSMVKIEIIPPRNPAVSNASSVRVVILSGVQAADDVFQRAEQMTPTAEVRVVPVPIEGLDIAVPTVLQGQMVAGRFEECPANYRVYAVETDQNLARSCGVSGTEFCVASSSTEYIPAFGKTFGAQNANDGVISDDSVFVSGCYGVDEDGRKLCGFRREWWQVDLSRQRDIKSLTIHGALNGQTGFLDDFDLQLSNDGVTFVNCATGQVARNQYLWVEPYKFMSTHACVGSARYVRLSMHVNDEFLGLSEVMVFGKVEPTCQCAPGHMLLPDMSTCVACAAGKYSAGVDSTACADCPADTFSTGASTACRACPANAVSSTGSVSIDACSCNPGYFFFLTLLEKRVCLPCGAGTFKSSVGNSNCTACWIGSSLTVGGSSEQACCPAQSTAREEPNAFGLLYERQRPKFHYSGSHWDSVNRRFLDVSGNDRHSLTGETGDGWCNRVGTPIVGENTRGLVQADISGVEPYTAVKVPAVTCPDGYCMVHMYSVWECVDSTLWIENGMCTVQQARYLDGNYYYDDLPDETCGAKEDRTSNGKIKTQKRSLSLRAPWTLCYAARITPRFNPETGQYDWYDIRLIQSASSYFGINNNEVGVYSSGWKAYPVQHDNSKWTVVCVKSEPGANPSRQVLLDGVGIASHASGIGYDHALTIGNYWTDTPWYVAQVLVWDVLLSDADMQAVSDHLLAHVREGQRVASGCGTVNAKNCGDMRCICNAGYSGPADGPCGTCAVGKYKNTTSKEACTSCPVGTFADVNGSEVCSACPENTFSDAPGAVTCSTCPNLTQSVVGSSSVSACKCVAGYTGAGGLEQCTPCVAGTFKTDAGSGACSACPVRTFSGALGATSIATCRSCHPNATSAVGSPSEEYCFCEAGFAQVNGTDWCALCNPGKYNTQLARTACSNCTVGLFAAGYGSKDPDSCFACPAGLWSPEGSPDCKMCPVNSAAPAGSGSISNCICDAGYTGPNGGPCLPCESGKYKSANGSAACTPCAFGSDSASGQTACTCTERFFASGGACAPRDATYLTVISPVVDLMRSCGASQTGQCGALRSLTGGGGVVTVNFNGLNDGNYNTRSPTDCKDPITGETCFTIDLEQERLVTEVVLLFNSDWFWNNFWKNPNYSIRVGNTNVAYVDGQAFTPGSWNTLLCDPKLGTSSELINIPGYGNYQKMTISCSNTVKGRYLTLNSKPDYTYAPQVVELQAFGHLNPEGSETYWVCNVGYTGPRGGPCVACAVGTYKNATGSAACTSCPAGQYQPELAAISASSCITCAADTFSNVSASAACTACPTGFKALPGTTTVQDCCGLNSSPQNITICTIINQDPLSSILATSPAYLMTSAEAWDAANSRFTDLSGNGRHGALVGGTVSVGSVTGNGASRSMPYVQGTTSTSISWPSASIPSTFTICSITRYSGTTNRRILQCSNLNWMHGHWNGNAGATHYHGQAATEGYSISPNTNWVVVCGRNIWTAGSAGVIANGVVTCTACGGVGNGNLAINQGDSREFGDWQLSRLYVWNGHLSNADFAEASAKLNSYVAGVQSLNCVPSIGCSCNTGYTGPDTGASKGQCAMCSAGTYKSTNGSAACTLCPANANSSVGSTNVTACSCNPRYTGPDVGPCVTCEAGKFKNASGPAACVTCPANTYSASGAFSCTSCPTGFQSAAGSREVTDCCDPNTTFVTNLFYSLSSATQAQLSSTYVVLVSNSPTVGGVATPASSRPTYITVDGFNGQPFLRFSKTSSTTGPHQFLLVTAGGVSVGSGLTIVTVVRFTENMRGMLLSMQQGNEFIGFEVSRSNGLQFCVCALTGGNGCNNLCTDAAVPTNVWLQVSYTFNPSITNKQLLKVSYTLSDGSTAVLLKTSTVHISSMTTARKTHGFGYSASTDCSGSSFFVQRTENLPMCDRSNFDLAGFYLIQTLMSDADVTVLFQAIASGSQIAFDRSTTCPCNAGFGGTGRSDCKSCAVGTYKSEVKSVSCSLCAPNTYSTAVQATNVSTCLSCPSNSVSVAGRFECECDFGYEGGMFECSACVPGKFKRFLGTSACVDCPANTEATGIAWKVCASLSGYNGLGYALDDVARSCGGSLSGTCPTLSNGATSNAAGGADGALDGSVSTSVSVTFGQNLARSCGNTGTSACATTTGSVYRPWWGVDFGRSRSVFAVNVMSTNWASTKDFKVVVGDVADAQSPLNAVCADYLVGTGSGYVKFTCEDTVSGRYLYIVNGPHAANSLILSDVTVDAFNYAANASLMLPWWAVDFEVERAVSGLVIQAQTASVIQVRVGHYTDPLQNTVCRDNVTIVTAGSNTVNCSSAMLGRYIFVIGAGNKVLVLNDVRVLGFPTAQCAAGTYKPLVGNHNCTACPASSTSVIGATSVAQCSCRAGYLDVWS
jgi:hypothetical protein